MSQNIRATWRTRELLGLLLGGESYGYNIAKATGRPPSSVYTSLKQLADEGWVEGGFEPGRSGGPPRRVYSLTVLGRLHAERLRDEAAATSSEAEAAIARVRALHFSVEGLGYDCDEDDTPGSYGHIASVCNECGTANKYGVRWPCPTIRALDGTTPQDPA